MATKKEIVFKGPADDQFKWRDTCELLQREQYERVAEFLQHAQITGEQTNDAVLIDILVAAHQICLACSQCQAEAIWHQQAYQEVSRREHELKQILQDILDVISQYDVLEPDDSRGAQPPSRAKLERIGRDVFGSAERPGILQRIQRVLGWVATARIPHQETSTGPVITTISGSSEALGGSVAPFTEGVKVLESTANEPPEPKNKSPAPFVVYCLGPFRVYQKGQLIETCPSRKGQAIFKYLVVYHQQPVAKDILMDIFWPEADPEAARRNLHQAIYTLRQTLKTTHGQFQPIRFENDGYQIDPTLDIWLDYEEFERHIRLGQHLEKNRHLDKAMAEYNLAEALYLGDFIAEDLYEEWPQAHRQYLQQTYLSIAYHLARYYFERGEYRATIALNQRILNVVNNSQEEAHQNLIKCYLAQGQRDLAIRQYHLCVQALKTELDLPPSAKTQALYEQSIHG